MNRNQRGSTFLPGSSSLLNMTQMSPTRLIGSRAALVALFMTACSQDRSGGGDPADGVCIPYEPFPGYRTCLMSTPQNGTLPRLGPPHVGEGSLAIHFPDPATLPAVVDHRADYLAACLTVHDQGPCGWCVPHATTTMVETLHCSQGLGPARVSEPHLWYEGHGRTPIENCDDGWDLSVALTTVSSGRFVPQSTWPFVPDAQAMNASRPSNEVLEEEEALGATAWHELALSDVDSMRRALAAGHEVALAVPVYRDTGWDVFLQATMVVPPDPVPTCPCENADCTDPHCLEGYHAVVLTGYDDADGGSFQFLNAWTEEWADGGYGRMTYSFVATYSFFGGWIEDLRTPPPLFEGTRVFGVDPEPVRIVMVDDGDISFHEEVFACVTLTPGTLHLEGSSPQDGEYVCRGGVDEFPALFDCGPEGTLAQWGYTLVNDWASGAPLTFSAPLDLYIGDCPRQGFSVGCAVMDCATRNCDGSHGFGCVVFEAFPGGCNRVDRSVNCGGP